MLRKLVQLFHHIIQLKIPEHHFYYLYKIYFSTFTFRLIFLIEPPKMRINCCNTFNDGAIRTISPGYTTGDHKTVSLL